MAKEQHKDIQPNAANTPRTRPSLLWYVGFTLMIFGINLATIKTVQHFKQEPREPLGFDLTLRWGDGGFVAYGVLFVVLGVFIMWRDVARRRDNPTVTRAA